MPDMRNSPEHAGKTAPARYNLDGVYSAQHWSGEAERKKPLDGLEGESDERLVPWEHDERQQNRHDLLFVLNQHLDGIKD